MIKKCNLNLSYFCFAFFFNLYRYEENKPLCNTDTEDNSLLYVLRGLNFSFVHNYPANFRIYKD